MKLNFKFFITLIAMAISFSSCMFEQIDAGHEGIKIKKYGSDKGVQDAAIVTGVVWYNWFTESVKEYPIYVRMFDIAPFTMFAKDGSMFTIDSKINHQLKAGETPKIFQKYRKNMDDLEKTVLVTIISDEFKNVFNTYTTDDILSRRQEFDKSVTDSISLKLEKEGFIVSSLTFSIAYPEAISKAIAAKNAATQQAQEMENKLRLAKAKADIVLTDAKAQAEANRLISASLTPALVQYTFAIRWDGASTLYGVIPQFYKAL